MSFEGAFSQVWPLLACWGPRGPGKGCRLAALTSRLGVWGWGVVQVGSRVQTGPVLGQPPSPTGGTWAQTAMSLGQRAGWRGCISCRRKPVGAGQQLLGRAPSGCTVSRANSQVWIQGERPKALLRVPLGTDTCWGSQKGSVSCQGRRQNQRCRGPDI